MSKFARLPARFLCAALGYSLLAPAAAIEVDIRMQLQPSNQPIKAFVMVTDEGFPDIGLDAFEFIPQFDGVVDNGFTFSESPRFDPAQQVSAVLAIDCSSEAQAAHAGLIEAGAAQFIDMMANGDQAAIVKFNGEDGAVVVQPFTEIDGAAGDNLLMTALTDPCGGAGSNPVDAVDVAVNEFAATPGLPAGARGIVVFGDGRDDSSGQGLGEALDTANAAGVRIFTVAVGDITADIPANARMTALAENAGGRFFAAQVEPDIEAASIATYLDLDGSYVLSWPADTITDCDVHTLLVLAVVNGAPVVGDTDFARCDRTPDDFDFPDATGVEPGATVVSNIVTIAGIETATAISVTGGEYSIGCGATFTSAAGTVAAGDEVCVRHTAAGGFGQTAGPTTLLVGGESSSFSSTTRAATPPPPPPGGGGGGGGAIGLFELLMALGAMFLRRRLAA